MARLPSMFKVTGQEVVDRKLVVSFYVRWWHPAAWRMMWQCAGKEYELSAIDRLRVAGFILKLAARSIVRGHDPVRPALKK